MKKFISNTILFLLFTSLFYLTFLFVWGSYAPSISKQNINYKIGSYGHMYSRLSEIKNHGDVDILFLGSSHAYRGFDTRIFLDNGYKSFNLGSSAQTPSQTKVLLKRYLESLNPEIVIYEVYPETFTIDGVESSLDIIANDKNDSHSLNMALKINNIKTYNTLIYGLTRDLLGLNKSFSEPIIKGNDKYISGGYVEKEIGFYQPTEFEKKEISLRDYQLESFSEIVQMVKNKNIELILVYAPIPSANYISYSNNHYFDSIMRRYSEYYNFNEILTLNDSLYFYDSSHLNQNGVNIFNKKLIELLNENKARTHNNVYKK
ncbi:hypothetical protein BTO04_04390 [Polaribacter sp. SA4-10]|uniref:hypothetical protein n=1 Tax=Polaribacter sp. SA4-10 TaxID=754397 RepID=UPI000B3C2472|nr:hypothetical protein [Polaribacter sp. SA4-10]ARV05985.1 hypothetical protein BTO04_04390 [Polaribacter sp. SA4-10]